MKGYIEKLLYIFLLFAVFVVCLFGMAFLRNTLGIGIEWQMLILLSIAAVWQAAEKWKRRWIKWRKWFNGEENDND